MLRIGQVEPSATPDSKYTDGNVAGGVAATRLRAAAFNAMQEELANIVESALITLNMNDATQVLTALKKLFLSRAHPFADIKADGAAAIAEALSNLGLKTAAQRDVGTGATQIPDMSSFAASLATNGYQKLPGGWIIQCGLVNCNANLGPSNSVYYSNTDISFPIAFPNAARIIVATQQDSTETHMYAMWLNLTVSGVRILAHGTTSGNKNVEYIVIGN